MNAFTHPPGSPHSGKPGPFKPGYGLPSAVGIGLKAAHYANALDRDEPAGHPAWVEVHPQNYFGDGGPPHRWLAAIAEVYP